jgi:hypothetical protein
MKEIITIASAIVLSASSLCAHAASNFDESRIEYLGGLTICANNPKSLADWYTNKFGLSLANEYRGIYFGTLKFNGAELNIGIHPVSFDCQKPPKGFAMTFRVDNYAGYLAKLAGRGLSPFKTEAGGFGNFAYFLDLEQNIVAIWGK